MTKEAPAEVPTGETGPNTHKAIYLKSSMATIYLFLQSK